MVEKQPTRHVYWVCLCQNICLVKNHDQTPAYIWSQKNGLCSQNPTSSFNEGLCFGVHVYSRAVKREATKPAEKMSPVSRCQNWRRSFFELPIFCLTRCTLTARNLPSVLFHSPSSLSTHPPPQYVVPHIATKHPLSFPI